jgi:hypothetical protein
MYQTPQSPLCIQDNAITTLYQRRHNQHPVSKTPQPTSCIKDTTFTTLYQTHHNHYVYWSHNYKNKPLKVSALKYHHKNIISEVFRSILLLQMHLPSAVALSCRAGQRRVGYQSSETLFFIPSLSSRHTVNYYLHWLPSKQPTILATGPSHPCLRIRRSYWG